MSDVCRGVWGVGDVVFADTSPVIGVQWVKMRLVVAQEGAEC